MEWNKNKNKNTKMKRNEKEKENINKQTNDETIYCKLGDGFIIIFFSLLFGSANAQKRRRKEKKIKNPINL